MDVTTVLPLINDKGKRGSTQVTYENTFLRQMLMHL